MTRVVSLAALTILDAGPAGQIAAAREAGWTSVGLRLNPLVASDPAIVGDHAREREVATLMRDTGLDLLEVGVFPIAPHLDVGGLEPTLAFAAKLGARFVVCPVEDRDAARRIETFERLCALCADHGLDALVEFNPYSACPTLDDALALVVAARRPDAGLVIDALHLSRSGGHPRDLGKVEPNLLKLVHFCDAPAFAPGARSVEELRRESRTARLPPGEGALPLRDLLAALPADCPISVEAPSARLAGLPAAERARATLAATQAFLARA